jgi:multidrug resistance efflux pump
MEEEKGKVEGEINIDNELDNLKLEKDSLKNELKSANEKIFELEKSIVGKDSEIETIKQSLEESNNTRDEMERSLVEATEAYKELEILANPGLVSEMIKGETIEEIKASVESARALVERVKQEIGAENSLVKVPAGSPTRTQPDLSTLSPREKIKYAMEGG